MEIITLIQIGSIIFVATFFYYLGYKKGYGVGIKDSAGTK